MSKSSATARRILNIALPAIVSNVTVPLLSLADTAIVGHLGNVLYIGAIAVASTIFNMIYWLFGFFRASTSGFTAQENGSNRMDGVADVLLRSSLFAFFVGVVLLLLQIPILQFALYMIHPTPAVAEQASLYFRICIWGAPVVLMLNGFNGWFIGLQQTRITMTVALVQNVVNVLLSLVFVFVFGMKVSGVALGTLLAQYIGWLLAVSFIMKRKRRQQYGINQSLLMKSRFVGVFRKSKSFICINRDIFLRTLCLLSVTLWFTSSGARQSNEILAANALLLQFFYLFSYFMDGFANAGESLAGYYVGAGDNEGCRRMLRVLFVIGAILSLVFVVLYGVFGRTFLGLLTDETSVVEVSLHYIAWSLAVPICSFAAFLWDGIYIGFTASRHLLLSALGATVAYFLSYYLTFDVWGNDALWFSFCIYLLLRGVLQTVFYHNSSKFRIIPAVNYNN